MVAQAPADRHVQKGRDGYVQPEEDACTNVFLRESFMYLKIRVMVESPFFMIIAERERSRRGRFRMDLKKYMPLSLFGSDEESSVSMLTVVCE